MRVIRGMLDREDAGMSDLRTGKWVCEKKGIPTDKLIAVCNSGRITAYSPESGQKILASSQCRKKFLFQDELYFSLISKKHPRYIAINKDDLNYFNIYLGKLSSFLDEHNANDSDNFHIPNIEAIPNSYTSIRGYHVLHEFLSDNRSYLVFFKSRCEISKVSDIYRDINYLYKDSEIFLQPKKEGRFTFRLLEFNSHAKSLAPKEIKFSIKKIEHEGNEKLILEDYSDDDISINYNGLQCMRCTVSPLINIKENRKFFSDAYKNCGRYFHQYKLNYFKPDDTDLKNLFN